MTTWTSWVRLHPVCLDPTLTEAVRARIADPLFMLGRQWQMGELRHDGGSAPVDARIETETAPVVIADAPGVPLEAALEREAVPEHDLRGLRLRRESGQQLVRRLRLSGLGDRVAAWLTRCPFPEPAASTDPEVVAWLTAFSGRVPDAAALRDKVGGVLATLDEAEADVVEGWVTWDAVRYHHGSGRFDSESLAYSATAHTATGEGSAELVATEHRGGTLAWHAWDDAEAPTEGPALPVTAQVAFRVPSPLQFSGQPDARYWTFEAPSSELSLSLVASGTPSPAASLVLEYALYTGNDWFLVTLSSPAGHSVTVSRVVVRDAMGDTVTATRPEAPSQWLSDHPTSGQDVRFGLPSTGLGIVLEGPELEAVSFVVDEAANVAWAVEERVASPIDGSRDLLFSVPPEGTPAGDTLGWRLAPDAPPRTWFPLIPVTDTPGRLVRGVHWGAVDAVPQGQLLQEVDGAGGIRREAIPPEGRRVSRSWQRARDPQGGVHQWVGRRVRTRHDLPPRAVIFDQVTGLSPPPDPAE